MAESGINENTVEEAALSCYSSFGNAVVHGEHTAPCESFTAWHADWILLSPKMLKGEYQAMNLDNIVEGNA
jgi:hypothetical protein